MQYGDYMCGCPHSHVDLQIWRALQSHHGQPSGVPSARGLGWHISPQPPITHSPKAWWSAHTGNFPGSYLASELLPNRTRPSLQPSWFLVLDSLYQALQLRRSTSSSSNSLPLSLWGQPHMQRPWPLSSANCWRQSTCAWSAGAWCRPWPPFTTGCTRCWRTGRSSSPSASEDRRTQSWYIVSSLTFEGLWYLQCLRPGVVLHRSRSQRALFYQGLCWRGPLWRTHMNCTVFVIRHYICLLIPHYMSKRNLPNILTHVYESFGGFIVPSDWMHLPTCYTVYVYSLVH